MQHTPHVYLVFWGPKWGTSAYTAAKNYVTSFFTDLGAYYDLLAFREPVGFNHAIVEKEVNDDAEKDRRDHRSRDLR